MKYVIGIVVLVFVLALAGSIYQAIATARDLEKYPPPGKLVDVGGYQLHLNCQGEGSPTVVMDYGLGGSSLVWSRVQPEVASLTRVCTYDRAGYGWSDPSPQSRTSQQMVRELYTLLKNSGIEGPYLLVGHSLGGLNLRLFASQHPDEVAGLILVDAVPANVYSRLPAFQKSMASTQRLFSTLSFISKIGLLRLLIQLRGTEVAPDFVKQLPLEIQPIILAKFLPRTFDTAIAENQLMTSSAEQVSQTTLPKDIPLFVMSHGVNMFSDLSKQQAEQAELNWQELQAEIANLSSKSKLSIAQESGHNIHLDQPKVIVNAIHQLLAHIRHN